MLYLVASPIGNLGDITYRAVEVLKQCDLILCEDTRHSHVLLQHYDIRKPLKSFHQFNEKSREEEIITLLKEGKEIAVLSDAGTPGICDPGEALVKRCREEGCAVTALPGPCAAVMGLTLSTMETLPFQFVGFLPKKEGELNKTLHDILHYPGTTICYESPHRIEETLAAIAKIDGARKIVIARELTKKFEECLIGTASELMGLPVKGEIVLIIQGAPETASVIDPIEHVKMLQEVYGLTTKDAIKTVAALSNLPKREIYNKVCK